MISVITAVFNGEKFIEQCIRNVIDQQCDDMEHVIVDGASQDRTVEIIKRYAAKYPHIRWISEKDRGQSDAMNKGIAMVKGEVISFLNYDDFYEPNTLNCVKDLFNGLPEPTLLAGNCNVRAEDHSILFTHRSTKLDLQTLLAKGVYPLNPSCYFYHRSLHKTIGLYDINDHYAMDYDFFCRAVCVHYVYVDKTFGNMLSHSGSKTVQDYRAGRGPHRAKMIRLKYIKKLPIAKLINIIFIKILVRFALRTRFRALKNSLFKNGKIKR